MEFTAIMFILRTGEGALWAIAFYKIALSRREYVEKCLERSNLLEEKEVGDMIKGGIYKINFQKIGLSQISIALEAKLPKKSCSIPDFLQPSCYS